MLIFYDEGHDVPNKGKNAKMSAEFTASSPVRSVAHPDVQPKFTSRISRSPTSICPLPSKSPEHTQDVYSQDPSSIDAVESKLHAVESVHPRQVKSQLPSSQSAVAS